MLVWIADMEHGEISASALVERARAETETIRWIRAMREALDS
jgi:hypothetical protein